MFAKFDHFVHVSNTDAASALFGKTQYRVPVYKKTKRTIPEQLKPSIETSKQAFMGLARLTGWATWSKWLSRNRPVLRLTAR